MRAEDVGWNANKMVLGKHSGRNAFRTRLEELGIIFKDEEELNKIFSQFKELADKKHEVYDDDLQALVSDTIQGANEAIKLISLKVGTETGTKPEAIVELTIDGKKKLASAKGGGPVDATYKAIESMVKSGCNLQLYSVNNITDGTD